MSNTTAQNYKLLRTVHPTMWTEANIKWLDSVFSKQGKKLKEIKAECQGHRDDHAPDEPKERELLEAIEAIVGRS
jgi:hypothetical protein